MKRNTVGSVREIKEKKGVRREKTRLEIGGKDKKEERHR